jgi:Ca2+-binding RTX toxin-like protein
VTIDWDDGTVETLLIDLGDRNFSASHQYLDDNPTGTSSDVYNLSVTLLDDDMGGDIATTQVKIDNAAPEIVSLSVGPPLTPEGGAVKLNCAFNDPGTLDTWIASINWGDGTTTEISGLTADLLESTHTYTHGGIFEISLSLSDDDMGYTADTANVTVTGAGLVDGVLYIAGTSGDDRVHIERAFDGKVKVYANFLPDRRHVRTFDAREIERIEIYLGDGNDHADLADNIKLPVLMDGGAGNDHLNAGRELAIMLGGEGNDKLVGGRADDRIYGGSGDDLILGGSGNDLIEAGSGNDLVFAGAGNDVIDGGSGNDRLFGHSGDDRISGGEGNDLLVGGRGHDVLDGGSGKNKLIDWSCSLKDFPRMGDQWFSRTKFHSCSPWIRDFVGDLALTHSGCNPNSSIQVVLTGPNHKLKGIHKGWK